MNFLYFIMPLRGDACDHYKWCAVCDSYIIAKRHNYTLRVHIAEEHDCELLEGCYEHKQFRIRHCDSVVHFSSSRHNICLKSRPGATHWCITTSRGDRKDKPSYANMTDDEWVLYPLREETLSAEQQEFLEDLRRRDVAEGRSPA